MNKSTLKTPSILSFKRKLSNSDALLFSGNWDNQEDGAWAPISIREKSIKGTISHRLKKAASVDPLKMDADITKPNLQRIDIAELPFDHDTLKVIFTLKILGDVAIPETCNSIEYSDELVKKINEYIEQNNFTELANRYAENLINARFLWRNRMGAEEICVRIKQIEKNKVKKEWLFNSYDFSLRKFIYSPEQMELSNIIKEGLSGESFVLLEIEAFSRLGKGQEIFPSQELILMDGNDKSKVLYTVNNKAAMHSQKIGNALRTIDTWYAKDNEGAPIPVEYYGAVTDHGKAYRNPRTKLDFFTLFDNWMIKNDIPPIEQQHFVMAILIRGGIMGESAKKEETDLVDISKFEEQA